MYTLYKKYIFMKITRNNLCNMLWQTHVKQVIGK